MSEPYEVPGRVHAQITRVEVSVLPQDHRDRRLFAITIEWRGHDRWAVMHCGWCLGTDGEWKYEPRPSSREDDWLDTHRFDYETALRLACEHAPKLRVNGRTAAEIVEQYPPRESSDE